MSIVQILLYISLVATILYIIWDLFLFHFRGKTPAISPHQQRNLRNLYLMVPALNEANTIGFTVKTILKDLKHLQLDRVKLVVIDDGSDDGTGEVLRHFKDPDLHVITRKMPTARHGKGDALNTGLEYIRNQVQDDEASATLIGVIDADSQPNQAFFSNKSFMPIIIRIEICYKPGFMFMKIIVGGRFCKTLGSIPLID
ncbi:glycosyltransferase [Lentilactobacillus rapi]|uniref:glycosyltransferase n=1 Tax=Lentilactobacillus rapi TaxID=481723 RepID=UPI0006D0E71F|nr:glycosyltransferase [Lentilactobacillus rapi]